MYSNITGIILAGGKSSRMGTNKALLKLKGKTIIEHIADLLHSIFANVIIITNTPEEYSFLKNPMYADIFPNRGPLAGIHSGLTNSQTEQNFIISCDIPLINQEMIKYILDYETTKPITVCKADGFIQQLAGRYSKSVLQDAEKLLINNKTDLTKLHQTKKRCKVLKLLDKVTVEIIDAELLEIYKDFMFFNMNRKEDYLKVLNFLEAKNV